MDETVNRFLFLMENEGIKMPWLEERTGIEAQRWHTIKKRKVMRTSELDAITALWPEYAYWLVSGQELPEAGQISPMTKKAQRDLKKTPKVG